MKRTLSTAALTRRSIQPKRLPNFLSALSARSQPLLLDLGPVIGSNVTFFGEELGCKILVENLFKDVDRHVTESAVDQLPAFFEPRFAQEEGTVDGIVCWDLFDYLDRPAAQALARQLDPDSRALTASFWRSSRPWTRPRRPHGATRNTSSSIERSLQHRTYRASAGKQRPLLNRDIQRLFEPLRITDQFLLKNEFPGVAVPQARP